MLFYIFNKLAVDIDDSDNTTGYIAENICHLVGKIIDYLFILSLLIMKINYNKCFSIFISF